MTPCLCVTVFVPDMLGGGNKVKHKELNCRPYWIAHPPNPAFKNTTSKKKRKKEKHMMKPKTGHWIDSGIWCGNVLITFACKLIECLMLIVLGTPHRPTDEHEGIWYVVCDAMIQLMLASQFKWSSDLNFFICHAPTTTVTDLSVR